MNNMEQILNSDFIISFGTFIEDEKLNNSILGVVKNNGAKFVYMHPIDNFSLIPFYSQLIIVIHNNFYHIPYTCYFCLK